MKRKVRTGNHTGWKWFIGKQWHVAVYHSSQHVHSTVGGILCENISLKHGKLHVDVLWLVWNSPKWPCLTGFIQFTALHSVKVFLALPPWISIWLLYPVGYSRSLIRSTHRHGWLSQLSPRMYAWCDWCDVTLIPLRVTWAGMAVAGIIIETNGRGGSRAVTGWVKAGCLWISGYLL